MSTKDQIRNELLEICNGTDFTDHDQTYIYASHIKKIITEFVGLSHKIKQSNIHFTRARANKEDKYFGTTSDLWYPKNVFQVGRGNFIQKPVFYCSNDPGTAIFEIAPQLNQVITTLEVKILKSEIELMYLGVNSYNTPSFNQIPEQDQGFHEFMEIIFQENINHGEEYKYLKTAIIVNAMLECADGVAYPSVGSNCKGWNVVFSKDFIDSYGQVIKMMTHKAIEIIGDYNLRIKCLHKASDILTNGDIKWNEIVECNTHLIDESIYH